MNPGRDNPPPPDGKEVWYRPLERGWDGQYRFTLPSGELFECLAPDLFTARRRRDAWLASRQGVMA